MEMTGERTLAVDQAAAWVALNDAAVLQRCVPGCESITASGPNSYDILVNVAIGPVKTHFKGTIALTEIDAPRRYTLRFEGQAGGAGFARGEAQVTLDSVIGQETLLRYTATAQVGGRLAQVGSRLIDAAAATMAHHFFTALSQQLSADSRGTGAVPPPARPGLWSLLMGFLRRVVKGR